MKKLRQWIRKNHHECLLVCWTVPFLVWQLVIRLKNPDLSETRIFLLYGKWTLLWILVGIGGAFLDYWLEDKL